MAFSPLVSDIEDALRLGAHAVGYTLYVGSPEQDRDIAQFMKVRQDAERAELPLIVWAYPRGEFIDKIGGRDTLYAIDYAARVGSEFGADLLKLNWPFKIKDKSKGEYDKSPGFKAYKQWEEKEDIERVHKIVHTASVPVMFSGGELKPTVKGTIKKARICMDAGAMGIIIGRNAWGRDTLEESLRVAKRLYSVVTDGRYIMPKDSIGL